MTLEDKAFALEFTRYRSIDSAGATRMLRWLQRNQDPGAHYCLTCADAIRHLHNRCIAVWEQWQLDNPPLPEKPKKRNGTKKTTD